MRRLLGCLQYALRGIIVYTLALPLTAVLVSAQEWGYFKCDTGKGSVSLSGPEILQRIQSAYANTKSFQADFRQRSVSQSLNMSELSSGLVWFQRPGMMRWDYLQPEKQTFLLKEQSVWLYQETERQVIIETLKDVVISDLPIAFVLGLGDLSRDFTVKNRCTAGDSFLLELIPKPSPPPSHIEKRGVEGSEAGEDSNKPALKGLSILIDKTSFEPRGAKVADSSDNLTEIIFDNFKSNSTINPSVFESNFPEGVDINDRRK